MISQLVRLLNILINQKNLWQYIYKNKLSSHQKQTIMTLYVKPISALLTHDTELLSNMDPYVIVQVGHEKKKTQTHQQGGKKPQWRDVLTFKNVSMPKMIVTVMDEDVVTDDIVGSGTFDLTPVLKSLSQQKEYIALSYKNRPAGKLFVSLRYVPPNNQGFGSSPNSNWSNSNNTQNNYSGWSGNGNINNGPWNQPNNGSQNSMGNLQSNWGVQNNMGNQNSNWSQANNANSNYSNWGQNNTAWGNNNNGWGNLNGPNVNQNNRGPNQQTDNILMNALQGALQGNSPANQQNQGWGNNPKPGW